MPAECDIAARSACPNRVGRHSSAQSIVGRCKSQCVIQIQLVTVGVIAGWLLVSWRISVLCRVVLMVRVLLCFDLFLRHDR